MEIQNLTPYKLILLLFIAGSCSTEQSTKSQETLSDSAISSEPKPDELSELEDYAIQKTPISLRTNWDDQRKIAPLSREQIEKFNLGKIISAHPEFEKANIQINERVGLSKEFSSILFNFSYSNDNEIKSVLINYESYFQVIDYLDVSYYEFAEGLISIESRVSNDTITISKSIFNGESDSVTESVFKVLPDGMFEKIDGKI